MLILGLSTMTESAAALMRDGELVAAAEEERFTRVKHAGGFPVHSIRYVLEEGGCNLADVDHVAVYWDPYRLGFRARYMAETMIRHPALFLQKFKRATSVWRGAVGGYSGWVDIFKTRKHLEDYFEYEHKNIHFLNHHECHAASTFYASPYSEAAILIMDGAGEDACTTWARGDGVTIETLDQHFLPHSLGHFYSAVTAFLGFRMWDGEYKLMGLSPYGDPHGASWIRENYLLDRGEGRYGLNLNALDYHRAMVGRFDGPFADYFGPPRPRSDSAEFNCRHKDIAASAQAAFEDAVLEMAKAIRKRTGKSKLCIAGGCGLNCVATGKIISSGVFDQVYVPSGPHDAGGSVGAAMLLYAKLSGQRPDPVLHAQYGPAFENGVIETAIRRYSSSVQAERLSEADLIRCSTEILVDGGVIAWFQGRMEFGPRALGNRSFLADPRNDSMRDALNERIKKRELFRPFAPSVKKEKCDEYFELDQPSPFMNIIARVHQNKRTVIPAVIHVDGTSRVQTVDRDTNELYWKLLDGFERRTGVPILLNTSFNIEEPIICTPEEALNTFIRSGVDALALGRFLVRRSLSDGA